MTPRPSLWRVALGLHAWDVVVDAGGDHPELLDAADRRSCCVKLDLEGLESGVLVGAQAALAARPHWAVVVEVLERPHTELARWAATWPTFLLDSRTGGLVRVPGGHVDLVAAMLGSGWLHPQDCLMTSEAVSAQIGADRIGAA